MEQRGVWSEVLVKSLVRFVSFRGLGTVRHWSSEVGLSSALVMDVSCGDSKRCWERLTTRGSKIVEMKKKKKEIKRIKSRNCQKGEII